LSACSADELHRFFDEKVAGARRATADAPATTPSFSSAPPGCSFPGFITLDVNDVITAVPDKQCLLDPMPTSLLKEYIDLLAPFLVELFNRSLSLSVFPASFKIAHITPLLKKSNLDLADVRSYQPISNLPVLSKLLERLVARQLLVHLTAFKLLPELQSAYRAHHSTETAVLKVLGDILRAIDSGDLALLTMLDMSAAFDTVDHTTILQRLNTSYSLQGSTLHWFSSYLDGRTQSVRCSPSSSTSGPVLCGVHQGSVLEPILFLLNTADLLQLIQHHGLHPHPYANDTQIYGFCRPGDSTRLQSLMPLSTCDAASWMQSNRLQLNTSKSEVLWCSSVPRQHLIPDTQLVVGVDAVLTARSVRNLGIFIASDVSMRIH